jgi:hypothetical protein
MIIKHSQGKIDSVYTEKEWKKVDEQKKVGKEETPPKKESEKKSEKKGS